MDELPGGSAIEVRATRNALRRSTLVSVVLLLAGTAFLLAGVASLVTRSSGPDLHGSGTTAAGTVAAVHAKVINQVRGRDGSVDVAFAVGDVVRTATVDVGEDVDRYHVGEAVTVRFAPDHPEVVVIDGQPTPSRGVPWILLVIGGVLLLVFGGTALRHVLVRRRILARGEWLAMAASVKEVALMVGTRARGHHVLVVHNESDRTTIVGDPVGLARLRPEMAPLAWVAGFGERQFVASAPGGGRPVLVQRVDPRPKRGRRAPETGGAPATTTTPEDALPGRPGMLTDPHGADRFRR